MCSEWPIILIKRPTVPLGANKLKPSQPSAITCTIQRLHVLEIKREFKKKKKKLFQWKFKDKTTLLVELFAYILTKRDHPSV